MASRGELGGAGPWWTPPSVSVARARLDRVRILRSALKHGCTPADIVHAVASAWQRTQVGEDPDRWLYVGGRIGQTTGDRHGGRG